LAMNILACLINVACENVSARLSVTIRGWSCRFLIRNKSVTDRNWEGDQEGPVVTYRSMAGAHTMHVLFAM
jgi:hypothetical protein